MPSTPFVIVADLRTGSTLLSATLNQHPQIRCRGELFHPEDFPDNPLPGVSRHALSGPDLVAQALADNDVRAAGFRAMVFHPDRTARPQWVGAWRALASHPGLRVIVLQRRDPLAQFASLTIAQQTGRYNPHPGDPLYDPEQRPRIHLDPAAVRQWIDERARLYADCRALLQGHPTLEFDYEQLADAWDETIARIEEFLGVDRQPLTPAKQKQEQRPLPEMILNYEELAGVIDEAGGGQEPWVTMN